MSISGKKTEPELPADKLSNDAKAERYAEANEATEVVAHQMPEDVELERHFLNDFPKFTNRKGDVRALQTFRRTFRLKDYENMNIFVMMTRTRDISAERVFAEDDENNVVFYGTTRGIKNALEGRGHEAKKMNLERKTESERADIFIMLDHKVRDTKKLLHNIEPRGWVLCRIEMANALRARGKYHFKGVIEKHGETASLSRQDDPTFWKSMEVDSDASFEAASSEENGDVVTYSEAAKKVDGAYDAGVKGMTENILKSYKQLIGLAEKQNPELVARGETLLPLTLISGKKGKEKEWTTTINTALPTKEGDHDDKIIVMRKGPM